MVNQNDKGSGKEILILGGVGAAIAYAFSQRGQAGEQTEVIINSLPYADVFVNDQYTGKTNSEGEYIYKSETDSGSIDVTIQKSGYEDKTQTVEYSGSKSVTIEPSPETYTLKLTVMA